MPGLKSSDLRQMSREDIQKTLEDAHQEMFNLRFQLSTRQLQNYRRIDEVRRNIARIETIVAEQNRSEAVEA